MPTDLGLPQGSHAVEGDHACRRGVCLPHQGQPDAHGVSQPSRQALIVITRAAAEAPLPSTANNPSELTPHETHPLVIAAALVGSWTSVSFAAESANAPSDSPVAVGQGAATRAEVKKIDAEQGKITLKLGPINNLGMPGMTMVFRVASPEQLAAVKVGDAVSFRAISQGGSIVIIELSIAP